VHVAGLLTSDNGAAQATGVAIDEGDPVRGDHSARRHDVGRLRAPDHRCHAHGRADERRPDRRPGVARLVAVGDAFCHTDPAFAYGLSFSPVHAHALAGAAAEAPDVAAVAERFRADAGPEARERYALACATDAARTARPAARGAAGPHRGTRAMSSPSHAGHGVMGVGGTVPPTL
jgi:flavin-dependent dehydrogenase